MSYFNEEQKGHARELASIPRWARCACGWEMFGECWACPPEEGGRGKRPAVADDPLVDLGGEG